MIDPNTYEGHTEGEWTVGARKGAITVKDSNGEEIAATNSYPNARLIADAPLLLDFITWVKNTHPHYFYKLTTAYEEAKK